MFEIEYYETDNGKIPVYDFINNLPMKIRAKAFASLKILSEYGNNLREPYSKYIDKGIFELRIKFSTDITRIFYFFIKDNKIILTNGHIKKQNKMDSNEFEKAIKYKEDYEEREKMNFEEHLEEQLKDEEFKKEWEDLQPEYSIIDSLIKARLEQGITQKQLSEMTGIQQSNISRLESGNYNPTINFLKRIAKALGKELYVEFK